MSAYTVQVKTFRKALLRHALDAAGGKATRAASDLGMDRTYLYRLMKKYGVGRANESR